MEIEVVRFRESDIDAVYAIQRAAYGPLYEKYRDDGSNPYTESRETVLQKYTREDTAGYLFLAGGEATGAVRVRLDAETQTARVSALCVLPRFQGRGVAQKALLEIERLHPDIETWRLDTILEEPGNCHLYEKLGYKQTGRTEPLRENMTLVYYEKKR